MNLQRILPLVLVLLAWLGPRPETTVAEPPPPILEPVLISFPHPGPEKLARLMAQGVDVWGLDEEGRVIAQVMPDQMRWLQGQGLAVQMVTPTPGPRQYPFRACYAVYTDAVAQMQSWADAYPQLAELFDLGPSWEAAKGRVNRRLWGMRLTNEDVTGSKPKLLLLALHHARETVTPVVALNLIETLLAGYGQDADITWLLDQRELWVVPFVNPDGYAKVQVGLNWRKNTNDAECASGFPPDGVGVDLNRNYGYQWGGPGASENPCSQTYRGQGPFSEPETQAVRDLALREGFDMVISLHAFGDLILYPWGYTREPAFDADGLYRVARVLSSFNGYTPIQSVQLYPTNGDTCDWVYGTLGLPCFTFEIGGAAEGYFWPDCKRLQLQWEENRDALLYALKLAAAPYELAQAPRVRDLRLRFHGRLLTVEVLLDDAATGNEAVTGGEVFVDTMGASGTGIPLRLAGGVGSASVATATATLDLAGLNERHTLYVFAEDEAGHRSPPTARYFQPCFDVTDDGLVLADDVMHIAAAWHQPIAQADGTALDLNADEAIDVRDVMLVAAQWGHHCDGGGGTE